MKIIIHTLFIMLCFFCFSANAFAKNDLSGKWKGQYLCAQGLTNLTISLSQIVGSDTTFEGELYFYPHQSNPYVPRGKHTIKATILDDKGGFEISPIKWIVHPKGYTFSQLYGSLVQNGKVIRGMVNNPGCKSFFAVNENAVNVDEVAGIPRGAQAQMLIDKVQHEYEKRTRSRIDSRISNQPPVSNKTLNSNRRLIGLSRTGMFKYEVESGVNKICFYDVAGDLMAHNVSGASICPLSHTF